MTFNKDFFVLPMMFFIAYLIKVNSKLFKDKEKAEFRVWLYFLVFMLIFTLTKAVIFWITG